jgi:hypothetical protein
LGAVADFTGPEITMAKVQSRSATMQEVQGRRQALCARSQAQHAKTMALDQMQLMRVLCKRQRMELSNNSPGTL